MQDLHFLGIGMGGGTALELGDNSAFLKVDKKLLIIDACENIIHKLLKLNVLNGVSEVYIVLTHTHADHVAGLGNFIWYLNFIKEIKPKIVANSVTFKESIITYLDFIGMRIDLYEFIEPESIKLNDLTLKPVPTTHTPSLECFGIMFSDKAGKYYYSGDTNDFVNIKNQCKDERVKKVYCEVSVNTYGQHIDYEHLKTIKCDKLVLMHFENKALLNKAKRDGFNVAEITKKL